MDILCFGEPLLEFNQQPDGRYLAGHGGDTSNCAIAAARSGARVGMFTHLGEDAFGDDFMQLWQREGIDTRAVRRNVSAHTGVYFVTHGAEGHQFSYLRKGSAASLVTPSDVVEAVIAGAGILHVSGISQAISESAADAVFWAIELARKNGVRVSYDTNLRLKLWPLDRARAIIHAGMGLCDIALPGKEDAVHLTGHTQSEAIADFYLGLGASIVALTLGAEGTLVATPDRRETLPSFPIEAIDATGAGDTFDGAFLAALARGEDPFDAARYANAAGALSTLGYGAVAPMPDREAIRSFLKKRDGR